MIHWFYPEPRSARNKSRTHIEHIMSEISDKMLKICEFFLGEFSKTAVFFGEVGFWTMSGIRSKLFFIGLPNTHNNILRQYVIISCVPVS